MRKDVYGYEIINGKAIIDDMKAKKIQMLYRAYIDGNSLKMAGQIAQIDAFHGSLGRILKNEKYKGTEFYPQIIDEETFNKVQEIRENRVRKFGRMYEINEDLPIISPTKFHFNSDEFTFTDPFKQAEHIYNLIESEWF